MNKTFKQEDVVTDLLSINQVISNVPKDMFISGPVCDLGKFLENLNTNSNTIEKQNTKYSFIQTFSEKPLR